MTKRRILIPLAAAVLALLGARAVDAQKKKKVARGKPACGLASLPFTKGAKWVYEPLAPQAAPGQGPAPARVTLEVTDVAKSGAGETITVEESYRDTRTTTVLTCDKQGLIVPPDSFLFAAEPGGALLMQVTNLQREGTSYPASSFKTGAQWFTSIKADVARAAVDGTGAQHEGAHVELERLATVHPTESVETGLGPFRAMRIGFEIRGRAVIGDKEREIPVQQEGAFWLVSDVGVVRAREVSGREWQLVETNLLQ